MYAFRTRHGPADLCFTDRHGGVSAAPFDELNLAIEGDDDQASVRANLHRLLDDFAPGAELCDLVQVHGADGHDGGLPGTRVPSGGGRAGHRASPTSC